MYVHPFLFYAKIVYLHSFCITKLMVCNKYRMIIIQISKMRTSIASFMFHLFGMIGFLGLTRHNRQYTQNKNEEIKYFFLHIIFYLTCIYPIYFCKKFIILFSTLFKMAEVSSFWNFSPIIFSYNSMYLSEISDTFSSVISGTTSPDLP